MAEVEIDKKWEDDFETKFKNKINSLINESSKKFDTKLNDFENTIKNKIDNSFNSNELKNQMNKICRNLVDNNYENNLVDAVLLCLSNVEPFTLFILEKKNEKGDYFSLFVKLLDDLWIKTVDKFESNLIPNQLKENEKQIYKSKNPGTIINFFLTKLHKELNSNNTKLSEEFFIDYKNGKNPIVNLNIKKGTKSIISDYHFNMLDDNVDIEDLNNNILIINLNRERDPLHLIEIDYPENLELKIKGKNKKYELISILLKENIKLNGNLNYSEQPKYKVYLKNFFNQKWYLYCKNIELVEKGKEKEKEILDGHKALLLVYKKIID